MPLSEQEQIRRDNLQAIIDSGIAPYPSSAFDVSHLSQQLHTHCEDESMENYKEVTLAGRLMMKRIMGKASFAELQDSAGRMQIYVSRDDICPGEDKLLYNTAVSYTHLTLPTTPYV